MRRVARRDSKMQFSKEEVGVIHSALISNLCKIKVRISPEMLIYTQYPHLQRLREKIEQEFPELK
jgi:hypothetical protein